VRRSSRCCRVGAAGGCVVDGALLVGDGCSDEEVPLGRTVGKSGELVTDPGAARSPLPDVTLAHPVSVTRPSRQVHVATRFMSPRLGRRERGYDV
jgi:hypothetical protein